MTIIINTTSSIKQSPQKTSLVREAIDAIEGMINSGEADVKKVEGEVETVKTNVEAATADASRIVHSLVVNTLAVGKDITVTLDHAAGEVKRIVVNGELTVEGLIAHIRNLAAKL